MWISLVIWRDVLYSSCGGARRREARQVEDDPKLQIAQKITVNSTAVSEEELLAQIQSEVETVNITAPGGVVISGSSISKGLEGTYISLERMQRIFCS